MKRGNLNKIRRYEHMKESKILILYFVYTFLLSWLFFIPAAFFFKGVITPQNVYGYPQFILMQSLGAAAPSLTAIFLIRRFYGKETLNCVFQRYKMWKLGRKWYISSILLYPMMTIISIVIYMMVQGHFFPLDADTALGGMVQDVGCFIILLLPVIYASQIISSPLLEELGWRGLALPLLQKRFNALVSSTIIGLAWGAWHLPLMYIYYGGLTPLNVLFTVDMVASSIIMTWLMNSTKGSMVTVLLFHASLNISINFLDIGEPGWMVHVLAWIVALIIVYRYGPTNLSSEERIKDVALKSR